MKGEPFQAGQAGKAGAVLLFQAPGPGELGGFRLRRGGSGFKGQGQG